MLKYMSVAMDLKEKIKEGSYTANQQLPSIAALCNIYDVSSITVKKALDELETSGLITRRRGSRAFVKKVAASRKELTHYELSNQMAGFFAEHASLGEKVTTDVREFSVVRPPSEIARYLGMDAEQFTYHIIRVRYANDEALAIEYTYMPIDLIPNLRMCHLKGSIYHYIESVLGLKIDSGHRIVRAVMPTKDECLWMDIDPGEPLLEIEQVGFLDDGIPFEYSLSRHPHHYEFRSLSSTLA